MECAGQAPPLMVNVAWELRGGGVIVGQRIGVGLFLDSRIVLIVIIGRDCLGG